MVCKVHSSSETEEQLWRKFKTVRISAVVALPFSVFSSVCSLILYFLSYFPFHEDHTVPFYFVPLPLHFLKQQESRSMDYLCEFKWKQKGCLRAGGVSAHPFPHLMHNLSGPGSGSRSWIGCKEMFFSITLAQPGAAWKKAESPRHRGEHMERGAQGSHGAQLKHRGPASQAAAPSHTQPMVDKTLKGELLCCCLLQQEPYPLSAQVCGRCWLVTGELREQLVRKK